MKEKEIISSFFSTLSNISGVSTISAHDFNEERTATMVVIGFNEIEHQIDGNVDSYKYDLDIIVDSYIEEDKNNINLKTACETIEANILPYTFRDTLSSFFNDEICVEYFNFEKKSFSVTETSNRVTYNFTIITSE